MNHESTARINHRSGYNCAQAVTVAFAEELHTTPIRAMQAALKPRSACGVGRISPGCLYFRK